MKLPEVTRKANLLMCPDSLYIFFNNNFTLHISTTLSERNKEPLLSPKILMTLHHVLEGVEEFSCAWEVN